MAENDDERIKLYTYMLEWFGLSYQDFLDMPIRIRNKVIRFKMEIEDRKARQLKRKY